MDQLLPETQAILRTLASMSTTSAGDLDCSISADKFKSLYTAMNECTSSSPSGRHLGHYKAALKSLQIVALLESDFNQSNRLAIGKPILEPLEDKGALPSMQYGSRLAKLCLSAVLNKQLTFKIIRYKKSSMAYIENDAVGCHDRIINPLVLLYLRLLGVPLPAIQSLAASWSKSSHRVKTLYGISTHR